MKDKKIKEKTNKNINITDRLQRYTVRTFWQLLIHVIVAIALSIFLGVFISKYVVINSSSFTVIASSMSAASGVLLAVSITLATFYSRHVTDWRDRLIQRLMEDRERLEVQMEKSAKLHPEISERLTELYLKSTFYITGKSINENEIFSADKIFSEWAKDKVKKSEKRFNFGDYSTYESFEKHLFDSSVRSNELRQTLIELGVAEKASRAIPTFSPLIITWVIIVIFSLVFAIIGGMSVIPNSLNFPILILPFYLLIIAIFALTKDITAILRNVRILEIGYEQAVVELGDKLKGQINKERH
jgi:hypothetical protein